jgi:hypothetical protein
LRFLPPMPMASILGRRSSLPKAAERSNPTTATTFPLALDASQAAWAVGSAVVHDLPFLKPFLPFLKLYHVVLQRSRKSLELVLSLLKSGD